jgi:hypothetical protein
VGKVVQHLQSVNCHDSRAHSHERHGPFTRLVGGFGWDGPGWVIGSCQFGLWYAAGGMPVSSIGLSTGGMPVSSVGLATGGMPVSSVGFGYRWNACERWSVWLQV